MKKHQAQILSEYGPFPGIDRVNGVTSDGSRIWFASDDRLNALDPAGRAVERTIEVSAHAGTAFDGRYLFQIGENSIRKIDPETGAILATIPAPEGGASGMAWADGSLWVGEYRARKIHQVDPETGKILRTLECGRFVTGVSWVDGELWHATWEDEQADIRHVDPNSGEVLEAIEMPAGTAISGLDADRERFLCGGGSSGKIRVVGRPGR